MGKDPVVETVRSFNRVVTQRIGALNERYLSRHRPLGEARLLWEIGIAELDHRLDTGFDPAAALPLDPEEMRPPGGIFLVAFLHGEPVGCGGLKFDSGAPAELKRIWVTPAARGLGIGRRLITDLEKRAIEHGNNAVRLDTNAALTEAAALYRSAGYQEINAFNEEPHANRWFEKQLGNPGSHEEGW
jgi:GNAT superfamily N-acetyltransferase